MNAIILCGLQASGKSTFYFRRFADTHVRINRDMLVTGNREGILLHACLAAQQPLVVDNTNPTPTQRRRYATLARSSGFRVEGYYFDVEVEQCIARNAARAEAARVPELAIRGTAAKLVLPSLDECFDALFRVRPDGDGFLIEEWP
jgi:predicted kinase